MARKRVALIGRWSLFRHELEVAFTEREKLTFSFVGHYN